MNRQHFLHACRSSLATFLQASFPILHGGRRLDVEWYNEATCYELQRVIDGDERRLIINQPPRTLKSITTSVVAPAFIFGNDPSKKIMTVTYSSLLAQEHARAFKTLIQSELFKEVFPNVRIDRMNDDIVTTDRRGCRLATTVGGSVTGFGADIIILDDPINAQDALSETVRDSVNQFFGGTLSTRLDDPAKGAIILVQQRLHEDDPSGRLLAKGRWRHLNLPAVATEDRIFELGGGRVHQVRENDLLAPKRLTKDYLANQQLQMGPYPYAAQYQQNPVPADGNMVKAAWFGRYETLPSRDGAEVILSLDTATKSNPSNDYSVCTVWLRKDKKHFLIDVWREKVDYPALREKMIDLMGQHGAHRILIEDQGAGTALAQDFGRLGHNAIACKAIASKESRLSTASATIAAGHVFLPKHATWLATYEAEMLAFPAGKHDDQVDSTSQYLNWDRESGQSFFSVDWGWGDNPPDHDLLAQRILDLRR